MKPLGDFPEVEEGKLEAYAIITAMGPTYLWFQLCELNELAKSFGLSEKEAAKAISKMTKGALKTLFDSGLQPDRSGGPRPRETNRRSGAGHSGNLQVKAHRFVRQIKRVTRRDSTNRSAAGREALSGESCYSV